MATPPVIRFVPEQRRLYVAAAVALAAELALVGGAWIVLDHRSAVPPAPPERPATLLSLTSAPPPQPVPVARPAVQPQKVTPPVRPTPPHPSTPVRHVVHPATPAPQPPAPAPAPAPVVPAVPATAATDPPAPRPAPAPAPAATPAPTGPSPTFESALRAAIEAALHYPESARMAGIAGRTRVAFRYRDGVVSDVTVVISSGVGLLDRAAVAAVLDANCPKPEPAFAGKTLSEQLWVNFNLDEHE